MPVIHALPTGLWDVRDLVKGTALVPNALQIPGTLGTPNQVIKTAAAMREVAALVVMVATAETGPMCLFLCNPACLILLRQSTFQSSEGLPGFKGYGVQTGNQVTADLVEQKPAPVQQIDLDRTAARPLIAGILNNSPNPVMAAMWWLRNTMGLIPS